MYSELAQTYKSPVQQKVRSHCSGVSNRFIRIHKYVKLILIHTSFRQVVRECKDIFVISHYEKAYVTYIYIYAHESKQGISWF